MADTVTFRGGDGKLYDVENKPEIVKQWIESGAEHVANPSADGIVGKVGEVARGVEESLADIAPAKYVAGAVADLAGAKSTKDLKASALPAGTFEAKGPDGKTYVVPDSEENRKAWAGSGATILSDADRDAATQADAMGGLRGSTEAFLGNMQNEYFMGLPKMAAEAGVPVDHVFSPLIAKPKELDELDKANPNAAKLGTAAGIVANILTPGLNMEGTAVRGEALATRALGKLGVEGTSLLGEVGLKAAGMAAKGAVYSAPRAAGELAFHQDPAAAAEVLLAGGLSGAALGGGGAFAKRLGRLTSAGLSKGGEALVEGGSAKLSRLKAAEDKAAGRFGPVERVTESAPGVAEKAIDVAAGKGIKTALSAVGLTHGPAGYIAGHVVGELLDRPETQRLVAQAAKGVGKVAQRVAEKLDSIPLIVDRMAQAGTLEAGKLVSDSKHTALAELSGVHGDDRRAQYEALKKKVEQLESNPGARLAEQSKQANALSQFARPEVVQQYQLAQERNFGWMASQMPRDPSPPQPFAGRSTWQPSPKQLSDFEQKLEIYRNPFSAIDELARGTLTRNHVEALDAMYPGVAQEMRARLLVKSADPNLGAVPPHFRQLLMLFGGAKDDASVRRAAAYQQAHARARSAEQQKQSGDLGALEGGSLTQQTRTQTLASR